MQLTKNPFVTLAVGLLLVPSAAASSYTTNNMLEQQVKEALHSNQQLSALDIKIKVDEGTVIVNGNVSDRTLVDKAIMAIARTDGVHKIINNVWTS